MEVRGILRVLPFSGLMWVACLFAITGSPPFGLFLSEFIILKAAFDQNHYVVASIYLVLLALIFIGMATIMLRMAQGESKVARTEELQGETALAILPPALLSLMVLLLGLYIPPGLQKLLQQTTQILGGSF